MRHERVFETMALACGKRAPRRRSAGSTASVHELRALNANALGCELAGEVVQILDGCAWSYGDDMIPAVWPGDVLVVERRAGGKIERGEIAVAEREGGCWRIG